MSSISASTSQSRTGDFVPHPNVAFDATDNPWIPYAKQRLAAADNTYTYTSGEHVHVQHARALLEKELHDAELAAAYIRYRKNLLLPIFLLPPEILSQIFLALPDNFVWRNVPVFIFVTHVCRTWRCVALETSRMWTRIPLKAGKKWTQAFLARSKEATIFLPALTAFSPQSWQYDVLRDEMRRVGSFYLECHIGADVKTFFRTAKSYPPARLAELTVFAKNSARLDPLDAIALRGAALRKLNLRGVSLPWDSFHWSNLRSIEIVRPQSDQDMSDFIALATSLASAPFLEVFRLSTNMSTFKPSAKPTTAPKHVQLPRLRAFVFDGFAADFQQLSNAVSMPPTARLDVTLHSDERCAAEASLVTALIQKHTDYGQQQPLQTIQALEIGASIHSSMVLIKAWQLSGEQPPDYFLKANRINVVLFLPTSAIVDSEALLLCRSIDLRSLRHLGLYNPSDEDCANTWSKDIWRGQFAPANGVLSVNVQGAFPKEFFDALCEPMNVAAFTPAQKDSLEQQQHGRSLFPSLSHIDMGDVNLEGIGLDHYVAERAEHAPINTLTINKCSVQHSTIEELRRVKDLELEWDGTHGECSEPESESDEPCEYCRGFGPGCHKCLEHHPGW